MRNRKKQDEKLERNKNIRQKRQFETRRDTKIEKVMSKYILGRKKRYLKIEKCWKSFHSSKFVSAYYTTSCMSIYFHWKKLFKKNIVN
jgi:hypothetical protein